MHLVDWIFVALPLLAVLGIGWYTQRYMKSVSQFMSGGRVAGRYLLAVSRGEMQAGAVVFAALFEIIYKAGFTWLRGDQIDDRDDGTVVGHQNYDELGLAVEGEVDPSLARDPKTDKEPREGA
jgi:hypothetical protein